MSANFNSMPYDAANRALGTPRSIERDAFARVNGALSRAFPDGPFSARAAALHDNRRLWSILADDALSSRNALPEDLRGRIVGLAMFVARHSKAVLDGDAPADVLVEINAAMMRGLSDRRRISA